MPFARLASDYSAGRHRNSISTFDARMLGPGTAGGSDTAEYPGSAALSRP